MVIHGFVDEQMEFWDFRKYGEKENIGNMGKNKDNME